MVVRALRVVVDGDSNKVYQRGDKVTGRVILVVEEQEQIESLKVIFAGSLITKTTRSLNLSGNNDTTSPRHPYEEKIRLFSREQELVPQTTFDPNKYSWTFEFTFPELTEQRFKRLAHGTNYLKEPHALPPSFQLKTNVPDGAAQISYFVQARMILKGSKGTKRCKHFLQYHPTQMDLPRDAKITSTVLHDQTFKPTKEKGDSRTAVNKVFTRHNSNNPRIVPCLSHPVSIAPGQHIPLSLTLRNTRDYLNDTQGECMLDSLSITISTYSTSMCGHTLTHPEDVVSKHVTCIARTDINKPLPFGVAQTLTSDFRLVDNVECVPTFKTYTITRRYALKISIGINFGRQHFTIRSNTPLNILPRIPRELLPPPLEEWDDIEPLPLYVPREPSKEFAPDYESIFALSRTASSPNSGSLVESQSSSLFSGASTPSTVASTPSSEIDQPVFEQPMAHST